VAMAGPATRLCGRVAMAGPATRLCGRVAILKSHNIKNLIEEKSL